MKYLCLVVVVSAFVAIAASSKDDIEKQFEEYELQCAAKYNITDINAENIAERDGACVLACVLKKFNVMDANNKFSIEAIRQNVHVLADSPEDFEKDIKVYEQCVAQQKATQPDECASALQFSECINDSVESK